MHKNAKTALHSVLIGFLFMLIYYPLALHLAPSFSRYASLDHRLILSLQGFIFPAFIYILAILGVSTKRINHVAGDPTKKTDYPQSMKVNLQFLSNTTEQFILFIVATLSLAIYLPAEHLQYLPINAVIFVLGRLIFWIGYRFNPFYRGTGFLITFFPSVCSIIYCMYFLILGLV